MPLTEEARKRIAQKIAGKFIVIDGPDGSGKTTMTHSLRQFLEASGVDAKQVREPGGTEYGELIRNVLLTPGRVSDLDERAEMFLFMAARAQLMREVVVPSLRLGTTVVADRFVSSTFAYQGTAGGIPPADIALVANVTIHQNEWPDLILLLDVDLDTSKKRLNAKGLSPDRIEGKDAAYHAKVREGYELFARLYPKRTRIVDASGNMEDVFDRIVQAVSLYFISGL